MHKDIDSAYPCSAPASSCHLFETKAQCNNLSAPRHVYRWGMGSPEQKEMVLAAEAVLALF